MKCIHCGANYKTKELECPYCHTPNLQGREWLNERNKVEKNYKKTKDEVIKKGTPYIISRIVMYIAIIMVVFSVITFIAVVIFFVKEEFDTGTFVNKEDALDQMEEYYDNGEYLKLYCYMSEHDLFDEECYVYSQAALLTNKYHLYMAKKMAMLEEFKEGVPEDDYYLTYAIFDSSEVYKVDVGIYDKEVSENQELYEMYREEIMSFWVGTLGLTDEEIELLSDKDNYITNEEEEALVAKILERGINQ